VKKPLADELLFGRLAGGGTVTVDLAEEKLVFHYPSPPAPRPEAKVPALVE
jgi:ATP-dependent Clp protease ATP-binding subunit ClpA